VFTEVGAMSDMSERHARLRLRAGLYALIRGFFAERGVLEVETPILSAAGNTDPNIESFRARFEGHVDAGAPERYLRTSPEYPLKRLLAEGVGDCYELGRVFRNGESGARHNPEFTMLEWYRVGWGHRRLADEVVALVQAALSLVERTSQVKVTSYAELFDEALDLDPHRASDDALHAPLNDFSIDARGLQRDDWLDLLMTHCIQPTFPSDTLVVVHDYPASQCALAQVRDGNPPVAERFEVFLGPQELANGYHELRDASEQRRRHERDNAERRRRGIEPVPVDENLLGVLDRMPDCAGVALGVDRLLMGMLGSDRIEDVLAYASASA
jgi:elongation factor P--(R)-beta-lysine ligase